ncbi:hypothetical protein SCHPADRAFT_523748 [Schizopora paradoxa]|uniref:Uncharacterized protein n=1 Tax=Schizopora paradoxa TaxID=27342 RepID=A0A0H2RLJ3_9AGAM|nr:hypothetical protein SCHPADRAFT_523748 [Schizopora paradoxa]
MKPESGTNDHSCCPQFKSSLTFTFIIFTRRTLPRSTTSPFRRINEGLRIEGSSIGEPLGLSSSVLWVLTASPEQFSWMLTRSSGSLTASNSRSLALVSLVSVTTMKMSVSHPKSGSGDTIFVLQLLEQHPLLVSENRPSSTLGLPLTDPNSFISGMISLRAAHTHRLVHLATSNTSAM